MRKRCTAILLAAVLVLSLLPVQVFAAGTVPAGWTPIYTLADIKECHSGKYILMNDIDASKEDVAYDGNGYEANSVGGCLFPGGILDGNGHTIYNLKGPLFECNMGTIKNLNVTISNSEEDAEYLNEGTALDSFAGIALTNYNSSCDGLIENCNVVMTVDRYFGKGSISIDGISSGGVIRNCIVKLDLDITQDGYASSYIFGIGRGTNNSVIDRCLVLGNIRINDNGRGNIFTAGITYYSAVDSACALENFSVTCGSKSYEGYESFSLACANIDTHAESSNVRIASDMDVYYKFRDSVIMGGKPAAGEGYTLASRASILADWDLSSLPGEAPDNIPSTKPTEPEETVEDPFPAGKATFHFSGSSGEKNVGASTTPTAFSTARTRATATTPIWPRPPSAWRWPAFLTVKTYAGTKRCPGMIPGAPPTFWNCTIRWASPTSDASTMTKP